MQTSGGLAKGFWTWLLFPLVCGSGPDSEPPACKSLALFLYHSGAFCGIWPVFLWSVASSAVSFSDLCRLQPCSHDVLLLSESLFFLFLSPAQAFLLCEFFWGGFVFACTRGVFVSSPGEITLLLVDHLEQIVFYPLRDFP